MILTLAVAGASPAAAQPGPIAFVQSNYAVPQSPQTTVTVLFPAAQTAGNLNVVVVGWNDTTATVSAVTDSAGNPYTLAVGPTLRAGQASQAIYFAKNILGSAANTVTVRFSPAAAYPDIRILEYRGLDPVSPLHATVAATGSSTSANSGALTTTAPNVLLVAANVVGTLTTGAGTSFTARMITNPDGDLVEDRIVAAAGSYSATAPLSPAGYWIMQLVAFAAPGAGPDTSAPTTTITTPTSGSSYTTNTSPLTLGGTATDNVGVTQVSWTNSQGGTGTATGTTTWSAPGIALQPGSNVLTVTARDAAGNPGNATLTVTYDPTAPTVGITTPTSAATYTTNTSPLALGGSAADNVGVTQVSWANDRGGNGTASGTTTWSVPSIALQPGSNVLTITARDAANNTAAATLTVTYTAPDTTAPTVSITTPTSGSTFSTNATPLTLGGSAADNVGVTQVSWTNSQGGSGTASGTTTWSAPGIALQPGSNVLTVTARDAANNIGTKTLTVTYDPTSPSVSLTAPAAGATVSGTVTVSASASDNVGVVGVQFKLDGANLGGEVTAPYSISWVTSGASNGTHSLTAVARDAAGNTTSSAPITVTVSNGAATIRFVQGSYAVPQSPQTTVTVAFPGAQTAGNLNVVAIGWSDATATVSSVTDSAGNTYGPAIAPTIRAGQISHVIYFAKNIASRTANTVTVRFSTAAAYPDVRILEYSGLDPVNPLHTAVGATGSSASANSGSLTTTVQNVLLLAANDVATATTGPGTGFTARMITNPDGNIVEDRIVAAAGSYSATAPLNPSGAWVMQLVAFSSTPLPPDNSPPTVAVTAPLAGSTVSATVTVSATASDDVGIVGVQFKLDGANLGAEVTSAPYFVAWNTTGSANGSHTLTAVARDFSNNMTTSAGVGVTVSNGGGSNPAQVGQWSATSTWPLVAVHAVLLANGQILMWDGASQNGAAFVWNPTTNVFTAVPPPSNIFCAGQCRLADGRVLVAGGHIENFIGLRDANMFNPVTRTWLSLPSMAYPRWYPTAVVLPDGRALVMAGDTTCEGCTADVPEIYDPVSNTWSQFPAAAISFPEYPHLYVLPDGRILATGSFEAAIAASVLNLNTLTWTLVDPTVLDGQSSAMYVPGKVVKSGTSATSDPPFVASAATTYVLDMTQPQPAWRQTAPMAFPRAYHNLTLLPDGAVLAVGGGKITDPFMQNQAVLPAELWSPTTETWTTMASMSVPRLYHSTALLLPDGRVVVAGGGRFGGTASDDKLNAQIYSPPYLFKGTRPVITAAPTSIPYGSIFSVTTPDAARIALVSLLRMGSVTHHFNVDQRYVNLAFQPTGNVLNVEAPANSNLAPPGDYMVFIVDTSGVPSVAAIVKIQ
ncbi:MAG: hypothetical protein DMD96_24525 [Candidatus Rokuibacteriota bacterium]|nr:MAG: hypothetical protein DMD96_24525 [Candidatus Rokubacteria bacterium]